MKYVILYASILITLVAFDFVWLKIMNGLMYQPLLGHLFADKANFTAIVLFYLIYSLGILFLVIVPSTESVNLVKAIFSGILLGFVAYSTYEFTNWATLKDWPLTVVLFDVIWGSFLTGLVSVITFYINHYFKF